MNKYSSFYGLFFIFFVCAFLSACVVSGHKKGSDAEVARANINLAAEYYRLNRLEFALSSLKKALRAEPSSPEANAFIALVYQRIEETSLAQAHFETAIDYVQSDTALYGRIHNNFGAFLCANNQRIEADLHFMVAAENKLYETPQLAYENAGLCALDRADKKKARLYFEAALAIDQNMPRAQAEIAKINAQERE